MKVVNKNSKDLNKPVTMGALLEYTDDFLIPKMAEMMDEKINTATAKLSDDLKLYIDERLAYYISNIFIRLEQKYQYAT